MSNKEQQRDKITSHTDEEKLSEEIVEQTMQEIMNDLADPKRLDAAKEKSLEEAYEKKLEEHRKKKKVRMIICGVASAVLLVYLGFSLFFVNHFYFGTTINGVSFSGKTAQDVEKYMKQQVAGYVFTLKEKDGKTEKISGKDIELRYKNGKGLGEAVKEQNPFLWITALFGTKDAIVTVEVDYNKESLNQMIEGLEALKDVNQTAPVAARPVYNGEQFEIQNEVYGTKIDREQFVKKVHEFVGQFQSELNLEKEKCYVLPKFTKDSPEVAKARDSMNTYLKASITYSVEPSSEVVDKSLISQWITVDDQMNVVFSADAVGAYVNELCSKYNTTGKVRKITTPTGKKAEVSGGSYGWKIDRDAEYTELVENIMAGKPVTRKPVYAQTAASYGAADWGTTYLEVDLSTQHMWYIVDGAIAFETAVITGRPTPDRETPQGVYTILEKLQNKVLKGEIQPNGKPEYEQPVDYWMRVTWTGIGFHDATWQPKFGGDLYKTKGSHGCINMPLDGIRRLYSMVNKGCPVVMHY